ncbi:MAG: hypothetical protein ACRENX_07205 [Candidatus Dormibacteria bacterium]
MAGAATIGLLLGSLITGCGSNRLGGLKVTTGVVANASGASTTTVPQGTDVNLKITISNRSENSVGGVTVRVPVPTGFTYLDTVSTSTNGNSERSADIAPKSKQATLTWGAWAMGPRASSGKSQVIITAALRATGSPANVQFSPVVYATGFNNDLAGVPLGLIISPAPSLNVQLRASPAAVPAGERLTYQVVVTNTGSGQAPDTSLGVTLPDDFDYVGAAGSSGNASLGNATFPNAGTEIPTWSNIDVPGAGSSGPGILSLSFTVEVLPLVPPGTYTSSATLVASTGSQIENYIQQNYTALAPVQVTAA